MRTGLVIFTRGSAREPKRLGFGRQRDVALIAALREETLALAVGVAGADHVFVASDERPNDPALGWIEQQGTSFEERFVGALAEAASRGFERLVVVGTDTPGLTRDDLVRAFASPPGELTIGPSTDGGFYLLGIDAADLSLLRGLPYRSPRLAQALAAHSAQGRVTWLARRSDLDRADDVGSSRAEIDAICRHRLGSVLRHARPRRSLGVEVRTGRELRDASAWTRGPPANIASVSPSP